MIYDHLIEKEIQCNDVYRSYIICKSNHLSLDFFVK